MKRLLLLLSLAGTLTLPAQKPVAVPLPKVPPRAHWRIDFAYTNSPDGPSDKGASAPTFFPQCVSVEYELVGTTGQVVSRYSDASSTVRYWRDRCEFTQVGAAHEIRVKEIPGGGAEHGLLEQYPGLEWLRPANFVDIRAGYGEPCFYFRKTETLAAELGVDPSTLAKNPEIVREAWISQATGLPVALSTPGVLQRFTFFPAPSRPIDLPPEYQAFLEQKFQRGPRPGEAASRAR